MPDAQQAASGNSRRAEFVQVERGRDRGAPARDRQQIRGLEPCGRNQVLDPGIVGIGEACARLARAAEELDVFAVIHVRPEAAETGEQVAAHQRIAGARDRQGRAGVLLPLQPPDLGRVFFAQQTPDGRRESGGKGSRGRRSIRPPAPSACAAETRASRDASHAGAAIWSSSKNASQVPPARLAARLRAAPSPVCAPTADDSRTGLAAAQSRMTRWVPSVDQVIDHDDLVGVMGNAGLRQQAAQRAAKKLFAIERAEQDADERLCEGRRAPGLGLRRAYGHDAIAFR